MIWSCEIDYSGWEDDIHHHHFFIESDTKPTEKEVAEHYNQTLYNPRDYEHDTWIQACHKEDKFDTGWEGLDTYGRHEYQVFITVEKLKLEKLVPLTKAPKFKKPTKEMLSWDKKMRDLFVGTPPYKTGSESFFSSESMVDAASLLGDLEYGKTLDVEIKRGKEEE